ncbi:MAG: hypothetical protein BroJett025_11020 [Patescibacteria group bacterium]|nr:MAG: hypothetical protein BroJett025_11020 [Patescibacteria group bacterium]
MAKKALAILLVLFSFLVVTTKISYAQTPTPTPIPLYDEPFSPQSDAGLVKSYRAAIDDDGCMTPSLECLVHQVFRFVSLEFVNSTLYTEFKPNIEEEAQGPATNKNILASAGTLIGHFYGYPVANTQTYVADLMDSAHITPRAYAQGLGFASLNPILELWKAFRNVAYMFFVVIFIIIGFMIMFRQRIGGQAAITAQQAIPSVIVSLLLVTFSYAIAGFMIDMMYVLMFLIIGIFGQTLPDGSTNLIDMTILQVAGALFRATNVLSPGENIDLVSNLFGSLLEVPALNSVLGIVGGLTLTVVLAVAILIGTVRLFFELLKSYASIVISVVTSPIVLMMGAIPGKNPIVPWIKDLIGNLLPFPVVLLVLVLFYQFKAVGSGAGNEGGFIPPFLIARGQANAIASLMGLALILALPEIVKDAKKGLVKEGFGSMVFKAAAESAKQGWKGGEIIPGAAWSAPGKYGVSGSLVPAVTVGAPLGAAGGAIGNVFRRRVLRQPIKEGALESAGVGALRGTLRTGGALGNKVLNKEAPKKIREFATKVRKGI